MTGEPRDGAASGGASPFRPLAAATRLLQLVAALLLLVMMAVTFVDVIGRYVFNSPLPGAFELTEVLLALVVFVGLPIVTARREHVTVDLLTGRLPGVARHSLARLSLAVTAAVLALLTWRLALLGRDYTSYGDATVYLGIPLGPVALVMAVLTGVSALVAALLILRRQP